MSDNQQIVRWANAIARATQKVEFNNEAAELGWEHDEFGIMAQVLVDDAMLEMDPQCIGEDVEAYGEFLENDSENWWHWIDQTIGTDWGKVAKVIHEEGY